MQIFFLCERFEFLDCIFECVSEVISEWIEGRCGPVENWAVWLC